MEKALESLKQLPQGNKKQQFDFFGEKKSILGDKRLIISFMSSFKINKVNSFPALTAPFPLTFLSNSFIAFEA